MVYKEKSDVRSKRDFRDVTMKKKQWICKTCDRYLEKNKMPLRSQANSLELHFILDVFLDQDSKELYPTVS